MEASDARREIRETLVDELKEAVGDEAVEQADLDVDAAIKSRSPTVASAFETNRLLIVLSAAAALMLAVMAALALKTWIVLPILVLVHALLSVLVIGYTMRATTEVEKPSPTAVAKLEERGVANPERALNDLVEQAAGQKPGSRGKDAATGDAGETTKPEEDPLEAAVRQQRATTPSSSPTEKAGG